MVKFLYVLLICLSTQVSFASPMHIVFSSDRNFGRPTCITIASILANAASDDEFCFYVIDFGIDEKDKEDISDLQRIKPFKIEYLKLDDKMAAELKVNMNEYNAKRCGGIATYARLFIPKLLKHLDKVIYLDVDLLIRSSIRALWNVDLQEKYAGVVPDIGAYNNQDFCKAKQRVLTHKQDNPGEKYFNAGVLVLNIKKMNEDNIYEKSIAIANEFEKIRSQKAKWLNLHDQDVLNNVFGDKVAYLDYRYNYFMQNNPDGVKDAVIVHFTGNNKPWCWNYRGNISALKEYFAIMDLTNNRGYFDKLSESFRRFYLTQIQRFK